ncbi:MAG: glucosyl-3-phosphoglycerate synthase [Actinomycetia bacterium]|nr:glucosyl-3-phosphoglycerate synthase [Actinomycetes bacterium]
MDREQWFEERTYQHGEFADVGRLVAMKEEQGVTFSVCLPTRNVESTVGEILRVFRTELMERHHLIDQLAIIDSRSGDGTVDVASAQGAEVFFDDEILTGLPPASGKGEALWKSLYVLDGDIIAWIDSDIENIHPRFAYGLIGPLLSNPDIGYVKGYYQRPLKEGEVTMKTGGGRVTELVVRPFLNLFYPELAGLIQPLSGEYAGRRSVLCSVPFLTGYGVETGLVLDILERYGLGSLAQVDLEVRRHHNQPLDALSRMSFAVMKAIFRRLDDDGKIELKTELETVYNTVRFTEDEYALEPVEIEVIERPPMETLSRRRDEPPV